MIDCSEGGKVRRLLRTDLVATALGGGLLGFVL